MTLAMTQSSVCLQQQPNCVPLQQFPCTCHYSPAHTSQLVTTESWLEMDKHDQKSMTCKAFETIALLPSQDTTQRLARTPTQQPHCRLPAPSTGPADVVAACTSCKHLSVGADSRHTLLLAGCCQFICSKPISFCTVTPQAWPETAVRYAQA